MTVNPLKGSTEIIVWKCQPSWCPLSSPCAWQLALSLSFYPSLPLIFFLLRGADSPDTIIQLYCGADTVAAVLCKGFPHMVWGQSGVSRCGGGTEKCRYRQKGLVTSWYTIPHCVTWQVPQTVFTFPISQLHCCSRNKLRLQPKIKHKHSFEAEIFYSTLSIWPMTKWHFLSSHYYPPFVFSASYKNLSSVYC